MTDMIVKKGVRDYVRSLEGPDRIGSDVWERLENRIKSMLGEALFRAKKDDRKTVKARDI